jgi:hypothetical protein
LGAGAVLGWTMPEGVPIWVAIVVLCILYAAISTPFSAMRRASYATLSGHRYGGGGGGDGLVTLALVGLAIWFAWMFWPEARLMLEQAYLLMRDFAEHVSDAWIWN